MRLNAHENNQLSNFIFSTVGRCEHDRFNCGRKNPCSPLCDPDQLLYPGPGGLKYVRCDINTGDCAIETCEAGSPFSEEAQECVPRS